MLPIHLLPLLAPAALAALPYKGADWSSTLHLEAVGESYTDLSGAPASLESILAANGVNTVRQRLWVNPATGDYDTEYNFELARRAVAEGLDVYLDFHYSDSWADPGQQETPAAWQGLGVEDLAAMVQTYTTETLNAFAEAGVVPTIVSIGNEITTGMLFPTGTLGSGEGAWDLATLLHAASAGVRASALSPQPKIMLHLDNGWDTAVTTWWHETVLAAGPLTAQDYDMTGLSFYPFYNPSATLSALSTTISTLIATYGKEVVVAETDWPSSCPNPEYAFPPDVQDIPISTAGQSEWVRRVAGAVEGAGGTGLFYWEPAWLDNGALGSSCESNLMFDWDGVAQESIAVFGEI